MAISRLTGQDKVGTSATSSVTVTYPSTATSGNLLIAVIESSTAVGTINISSWNKRFDLAITAGSSVAVYDVISAGTETAVVANASGSASMQMAIYEYTGNANPIVVDTSNSLASQATNTTITEPNITTTLADDLIFSFVGTNGSTGTVNAWTTSTHLQQNSAATRLIMGQYLPGTIVTNFGDTVSWTTTRSNAYGAIAYEAASSTTTSTSSTSTSSSISTSSTSSSTSVSTSTSSTSTTFTTSTSSTSVSSTSSSTSTTTTLMDATFFPRVKVKVRLR